MDAGSVDAVITDPPYGVGLDYASFLDTSENVKDVIIPIVKFMIEKFRCVILTPGNRNFSSYPQPDSFGCFYQPSAVSVQRFGNLDAQPIFYYGKRASGTNMGKPCSYRLTEKPDKNGHPCAKPINTWRKLIANNTKPGDTIFDPFMGSGTTGVAAVQLGRNFIGCELDAGYFAIAQRRIHEATLQPQLFQVEKPPAEKQGGLL
jgi:DNA modification methylase